MPSESRTIEDLRTALRATRQSVSPRTIAKESGVSHTKVYELIRDGEISGTVPEVQAALWTWLDGRRQDPSGRVTDDPGGTVPVSLYALGLIRGTLTTTAAWLGSVEGQMDALGNSAHALSASAHALGQTITALRATLDRATNGVADLITDGILPDPNGLPPGWHMPPLREPTPERQAEIDREPAPSEAEAPNAKPAAPRKGGRSGRGGGR